MIVSQTGRKAGLQPHLPVLTNAQFVEFGELLADDIGIVFISQASQPDDRPDDRREDRAQPVTHFQPLQNPLFAELDRALAKRLDPQSLTQLDLAVHLLKELRPVDPAARSFVVHAGNRARHVFGGEAYNSSI